VPRVGIALGVAWRSGLPCRRLRICPPVVDHGNRHFRRRAVGAQKPTVRLAADRRRRLRAWLHTGRHCANLLVLRQRARHHRRVAVGLVSKALDNLYQQGVLSDDTPVDAAQTVSQKFSAEKFRVRMKCAYASRASLHERDATFTSYIYRPRSLRSRDPSSTMQQSRPSSRRPAQGNSGWQSQRTSRSERSPAIRRAGA
jgi:hypothetical protein